MPPHDLVDLEASVPDTDGALAVTELRETWVSWRRAHRRVVTFVAVLNVALWGWLLLVVEEPAEAGTTVTVGGVLADVALVALLAFAVTGLASHLLSAPRRWVADAVHLPGDWIRLLRSVTAPWARTAAVAGLIGGAVAAIVPAAIALLAGAVLFAVTPTVVGRAGRVLLDAVRVTVRRVRDLPVRPTSGAVPVLLLALASGLAAVGLGRLLSGDVGCAPHPWLPVGFHCVGGWDPFRLFLGALAAGMVAPAGLALGVVVSRLPRAGAGRTPLADPVAPASDDTSEDTGPAGHGDGFDLLLAADPEAAGEAPVDPGPTDDAADDDIDDTGPSPVVDASAPVADASLAETIWLDDTTPQPAAGDDGDDTVELPVVVAYERPAFEITPIAPPGAPYRAPTLRVEPSVLPLEDHLADAEADAPRTPKDTTGRRYVPPTLTDQPPDVTDFLDEDLVVTPHDVLTPPESASPVRPTDDDRLFGVASSVDDGQADEDGPITVDEPARAAAREESDEAREEPEVDVHGAPDADVTAVAEPPAADAIRGLLARLSEQTRTQLANLLATADDSAPSTTDLPDSDAGTAVVDGHVVSLVDGLDVERTRILVDRIQMNRSLIDAMRTQYDRSPRIARAAIERTCATALRTAGVPKDTADLVARAVLTVDEDDWRLLLGAVDEIAAGV